MTLEDLIRDAQANGLDELRVRWCAGPSIQVIAVHKDARRGPWSVGCHDDMPTAIRLALEGMPRTGSPVEDDLEGLL